MVDQRTLWCQTIILASTIMILALIAVLIQGVLPWGVKSSPTAMEFLPSNSTILVEEGIADYAYSITNAGSMIFLFLAIVIYIEIVNRVSVFNIARSKEHSNFLRLSMIEARQLLKRIRNKTYHFGQLNPANLTSEVDDEDSDDDDDHGNEKGEESKQSTPLLNNNRSFNRNAAGNRARADAKKCAGNNSNREFAKLSNYQVEDEFRTHGEVVDA